MHEDFREYKRNIRYIFFFVLLKKKEQKSNKLEHKLIKLFKLILLQKLQYYLQKITLNSEILKLT